MVYWLRIIYMAQFRIMVGHWCTRNFIISLTSFAFPAGNAKTLMNWIQTDLTCTHLQAIIMVRENAALMKRSTYSIHTR